MRDTLRCCLGLVLLAGISAGKAAPAKEVRENATASAAYVQDAFVQNLRDNLAERFSKDRSRKMIAAMSAQEFSSSDVIGLMNGRGTDKKLRGWFGANRAETERVREALNKTVREKEKGGFFGIMTDVMIGDFGVDPSAEFAQQACGARDEIAGDSMKKLLAGNISKRTVEEAFGFSDTADQKFMQDILRRTMQTDFVAHPMLQSMGLSKGRAFDARRFRRKLTKSNAGYGSFADGTAGGLPVDPKLPPFPYFGKNLAKHFAGAESR